MSVVIGDGISNNYTTPSFDGTVSAGLRIPAILLDLPVPPKRTRSTASVAYDSQNGYAMVVYGAGVMSNIESGTI
jgi:hypothetical protein